MKLSIGKLLIFFSVVQLPGLYVSASVDKECKMTLKGNFQEILTKYIDDNRPVLKKVLSGCKASVEKIQNKKEACDSGRPVKSICSDKAFTAELNKLMDRCVFETSQVIGSPPKGGKENECSESIQDQAKKMGGRKLETEFKPQFTELIGLAQKLLFLLR